MIKTTTALAADAALVANGKLYIHGGGWDTIHTASFPTTHPAMAIAFVLEFDYTEAPDRVPIRIDLLDDDEVEMGLRLETILEVGHPPGSSRGNPIQIPQAITLPMVSFPKPGGYRFRISARSQEVGSIKFHLASLPQLPT